MKSKRRSCQNCFWSYNCYNPSEDSEYLAEICPDYSENGEVDATVKEIEHFAPKPQNKERCTAFHMLQNTAPDEIDEQLIKASFEILCNEILEEVNVYIRSHLPRIIVNCPIVDPDNPMNGMTQDLLNEDVRTMLVKHIKDKFKF